MNMFFVFVSWRTNRVEEPKTETQTRLFCTIEHRAYFQCTLALACVCVCVCVCAYVCVCVHTYVRVCVFSAPPSSPPLGASVTGQRSICRYLYPWLYSTNY